MKAALDQNFQKVRLGQRNDFDRLADRIRVTIGFMKAIVILEYALLAASVLGIVTGLLFMALPANGYLSRVIIVSFIAFISLIALVSLHWMTREFTRKRYFQLWNYIIERAPSDEEGSRALIEKVRGFMAWSKPLKMTSRLYDRNLRRGMFALLIFYCVYLTVFAIRQKMIGQ